MDRDGVGEAVARLRADLDALLSADLTGLEGVEVTTILKELEIERRRLDAVDVRLVAEIDQRGTAGEFARTSTVDLLVTLLRITPAGAKGRLARTRDLGPRRAVTGEPLPPLQPLVADALADGELSAAHAAVISRCLDRLPVHLPDEATVVAERFLVEAARHQQPKAVAVSAAMLLARLDPDGAAPDDREIERRREFTLHKNADGSARGTMLLTPEATATWETIIDALSAPIPATDGMPDDRGPAQRRHDAFHDAGLRLLSSASLPAAGGAPVTVVVTARLDDLRHGRGAGLTGHGDVWPIRRVLADVCEWDGCDGGPDAIHSCTADVVPMVIDDVGAPLWVGRTRRLATRAQRLALIARDGGCSFPGCDRPATWSEVHHVREWRDGGPTDIDNLCLLCRFHHREFERRGWQVRMTDGLPHWVPPPFIDAEQRPIRNHAHHPPDFEFASRLLAS